MFIFTNSSLILPIAGTTTAYFIGLIIYRLFFDSLSKFPGPKLAAITRYYEAYYDVVKGGQYTFKIAELHKEYGTSPPSPLHPHQAPKPKWTNTYPPPNQGPIIRISPYELHIHDPSYFTTLYRQEGTWNKYPWTYKAFATDNAAICSAEHHIHKRRVAPLRPFFSKATVSRRQDLIHKRADKLCERVSEYASSSSSPSSPSLNLGSALSALTVDVATEYILGRSYDNLSREDFNKDMTGMFQSSGRIWRVGKHLPWLGPALKGIPVWVIQGMDRKAGAVFEYLGATKDVIAEHASGVVDKESPHTIIHEILRADMPESEKSFHRVEDDVITVTGGGFETVAQSLRAIIYYIYSNAEVLQRLRTELTGAKAKAKAQDGNIPLRDLEQLPYLTAVITEGLRLSPGLATRMARIAPDRELVYGQWKIPAGTPVGMTALLMHLDESVYPDAKKFHPERWTDTEKRRIGEKTYAPFSRGTRSCLGMQYVPQKISY
ncbi:hypothetical protein FQN54_000392 [Arachnomyces sp. PD_36]|nr:hypothetical protein FQN54_000392 [Arachnomyces sp. PD_36]